MESTPSSRGGMRVNEANPIRASAVVPASVVRMNRYRCGARRNATTSTPMVTMKWAVP